MTTATASAIEAATVEIHTLTVNGRRMTAGLLRQLTESPIINKAGRIDGVPWGRVNYHPEGCSEAPEHLHVVWQLGDELRRSYVGNPVNACLRHPLAGEYVMARIAEGGRRDAPNITIRRSRTGDVTTSCNIRGLNFTGTATGLFLNAWELYDINDGITERLQRNFAEHFGHPLRESTELAELLMLPVEGYKESWRALNDLPQLFIGG